jgi:ubiquinone/menaquinone biosynthesis C-methylase UbiE
MYKLWKRYLPASAKHRSMVFWYNLISRFDTGDDLLFLNHGYAAPDGDPDTADLDPADEKNRYSIQLYHQLTASTDWHGKQALEVSSGRGGGTDWVMRTFRPRSLVGLDIAKVSTRFCRRHYSVPGLSFETGDAQAMPFADGSFDIVFNVESSLNYPDFDAYLREVDRVLRPGGRFLIADYRRRKGLRRFEAALRATGYDVVRLENISAQIIRGLELSESRKVAMIEKHAPRLLRNTIQRFARISNEDDSEYELFRGGTKGYLIAILEKPA